MARAAALALALLALGALGGGCGEEAGVADGATVSVYVATPLCEEVLPALEGEGEKVDGVRIKAICLADLTDGSRLDLATVGANARRATEDSTAIAFIEFIGPGAAFSRPIVEAAGIAWIETKSGKAALAEVLGAVEEAGSGSLRGQVREALESP